MKRFMRMDELFSGSDKFEKIAVALIAVCLVSMALSIRIVNSISLILMGIVPLFHPQRIQLLRKAFRNPFFLSCLAMAIIEFLGILYTKNPEKGFDIATSRAGIVPAPFLFAVYPLANVRIRRFLVLLFGIALFCTSVAALIHAAIDYRLNHNIDVFFYHTLITPFDQHAVFFSFFLFTCIVFWVEKDIHAEQNRRIKLLMVFLTVFFLGMIFLLSSKLVIAILILYFAYLFLRNLISARSRKSTWILSVALILIVPAVVFTNNPIRDRFTDLEGGDINLFRANKYDPEVYFNGIQFRLLNWRLTYEILKDHNAWILGVTPADAQPILDLKYESLNIATGDGSKSKGYLGYHTHNQFLQSSLESGFIGLLALLLMFTSLLVSISRTRSRESLIITLGIIAFCFTDAIMHAQYGLVIMTLFPLLGIKKYSV